MRKLLLGALLGCVPAGAALAADISGTWHIQGAIAPNCTFVQSGTSLNGACRGANADGPLSGSIDGQSVSWTFNRKNMNTGVTMAPVQFTATLDGQTLSGTMTLNGANPAPFTAQLRPNAEPIRLASAAPAAPPPAAPVQAQAAINTKPPRTVFGIDTDGSATHVLTGMVCPAAASGWRRVSTSMYDKSGFDVSCGYRDPAGSTISLYMTRREAGLLTSTFEAARKSVSVISPSAVTREGTAEAPPGFQWLSAGFSQLNGAEDSDLFLTQVSDWEYKIRATYRPADMAPTSAAMAALSDTVRRTAGNHLAACAASAAPVRNGQRNSNTEQLMGLAAVTAVMVKLTALPAPTDSEWCAETGFGNATENYVYWRRSVTSQDGPMDRITNVGGAEGTTVFVLHNPRELVEKTAGTIPDSKPPQDTSAVFGVVVDRGDQFSVAGIYNGRPSWQEVARLVLGGGAYGIYASVSKADGKTTVFRPF